MTERTRFANRRQGWAQTFKYGPVEYRVTSNRFIDGDIGELFLDAGKTGSDAHIIAKEAAVLFSLARQYGCPLRVIKAALLRLEDGGPAGPTGMALALAEQNEPLLEPA